ncbi:MAG: type I DNA topoisomerase [Oscillospiraceae bacterium]|nr:type I DNA topoisomerase [Oscillospiraceae bacterium]
MAKAKTELVIVESPAKAKTIEKYLGGSFRVVASMGHLRDLPRSRMGVDIEHDFTPEYIPVKGREALIEELQEKASKAKTVYLATDPDREGEAISWHLKELLSIPDEKAKRVTFNEITKKVVTENIRAPREIDMDLVNAQQARRVLDRLVGYTLSPLLWRKMGRPRLSAGRVQSVATRIVVDRENEIRAFQPEEYWLLDVSLRRETEEGGFLARYLGRGGKKTELHSAEDVDAVISETQGQPFHVSAVKRGEKQRTPSAPFITSSLQQEASRRLGMTPARTMSIAQQLYEGVDIEGQGTVGLITYMRTDSLRISDEALAAAGEYIRAHYGAQFYPGKPRTYKTKNGAQDAHEAIRPSNVSLSPELLKKDLSGDQYRLYRLIWGRFIASQMANVVYDNVVIDVASGEHVFRANHSEIKFPGYTAVYEEGKDEESDEPRRRLPNLNEGELLSAEKFNREQKFTQPPARYTEATLIRALEEKGIGRPSTYAPTISTITSREYVAKDGRYLKPTPLGETVNKLMCDYFQDIVDLKFTARMEDSLDEIEEGKKEWKGVLREFYDGFDAEMKSAETALDGVRIKVPDEESDEICSVCGRKMVVKSGRFGRFLACPGFPECTFTKPIVIEMPGKCPKCGSRILKRTSKKGYTYYACERGADCGFMTWNVPVAETCPDCGKTLFKLSGRGKKKTFCINEACPNFLPEDQRGYRKKPAAAAEGESTPASDAAAPAPEASASVESDAAVKSDTAKTAGKPKAAAKKSAAKKPAARKATTKKTTARKPAAEKPVAAEE